MKSIQHAPENLPASAIPCNSCGEWLNGEIRHYGAEGETCAECWF